MNDSKFYSMVVDVLHEHDYNLSDSLFVEAVKRKGQALESERINEGKSREHKERGRDKQNESNADNTLELLISTQYNAVPSENDPSERLHAFALYLENMSVNHCAKSVLAQRASTCLELKFPIPLVSYTNAALCKVEIARIYGEYNRSEWDIYIDIHGKAIAKRISNK